MPSLSSSDSRRRRNTAISMSKAILVSMRFCEKKRVEKDRNYGYLYEPGTPEAGWRAHQEGAGSRCPLLPTETRKIELKLFFLNPSNLT